MFVFFCNEVSCDIIKYKINLFEIILGPPAPCIKYKINLFEIILGPPAPCNSVYYSKTMVIMSSSAVFRKLPKSIRYKINEICDACVQN